MLSFLTEFIVVINQVSVEKLSHSVNDATPSEISFQIFNTDHCIHGGTYTSFSNHSIHVQRVSIIGIQQRLGCTAFQASQRGCAELPAEFLVESVTASFSVRPTNVSEQPTRH